MSSINVVYVGGNLVRNPEIKKVGKYETSVVNFSVVTNEHIKKDGPPKATFFNIVAWGDLAKHVHENFRKGNEICVSGSFETEKYEKDGVERTAYKVTAKRVGRDLGDILLGGLMTGLKLLDKEEPPFEEPAAQSETEQQEEPVEGKKAKVPF